MISTAFIFTVDNQGNYQQSYEMEVLLGKGSPKAEETRTKIQALYESMTGYRCEVRWDYEFRGEDAAKIK